MVIVARIAVVIEAEGFLIQFLSTAFAVAGFLPLGLLIVVMIIVCFHITRLRRKAKRLVRLEPPCEEFETQPDAEESNGNTRETRL